MSTIADNLARLKITLPPKAKPAGLYLPFVKTGNLVYISGQIPKKGDQLPWTGSVPAICSLTDAQEAARQCILNALSILEEACDGDLDKIKQIVRMNVFVNATRETQEIIQVANAASELLINIFGDAGRHTRAAIGVSQLPLSVPVELDLIAEVRP